MSLGWVSITACLRHRLGGRPVARAAHPYEAALCAAFSAACSLRAARPRARGAGSSSPTTAYSCPVPRSMDILGGSSTMASASASHLVGLRSYLHISRTCKIPARCANQIVTVLETRLWFHRVFTRKLSFNSG